MARAGLIGGLLLLVAPAALIAARRDPPGRLVQPAGKRGCVHKSGVAGCARARAVAAPSRVVVSPDGRHVYVSAFDSNAIAVFARSRTTGTLRQLSGKRGCVSHRGAGTCAFGRALGSPISVAVSRDGRNVYVAATGSGALAVFSRNRRTGALRQLPGAKGCISQRPGGGCAAGRGLNDLIEVIVSRDGKRVYAASRQSPSGVAVFLRRRDGTLAQPAGTTGCISDRGSQGCAAGHGLRSVWDLAASPDGESVYAVGFDSDSVAVLRRTPQGLSQPDGPAGCLARTAEEGCAVGRALNGATGVAVSPDAGNVYVASFESDAVAILRRDKATGGLSQLEGTAGCVRQAGGGGCRAGRALDGAHGLVVSPDGGNLYVVSEEINAMGIYARNRSTGGLTPLRGKWGCLVRGGVLGCPDARGLTIAVNITASSDGRNVYVGSEDRRLGAIGIFRRLR